MSGAKEALTVDRHRLVHPASRRRGGFAIFRHLGPGLITGAADEDPSGIGTYSQLGAQFGLAMLWTVPISLFWLPPLRSWPVALGWPGTTA